MFRSIESFNSPSIDRLSKPGEPDAEMGEGRGVMSTNGPTPGEDSAEAGVSESDRRVLEEKTERILELLTGRPALKMVSSGLSVVLTLANEDGFSVFLSFRCSVWSRRAEVRCDEMFGAIA